MIFAETGYMGESSHCGATQEGTDLQGRNQSQEPLRCLMQGSQLSGQHVIACVAEAQRAQERSFFYFNIGPSDLSSSSS